MTGGLQRLRATLQRILDEQRLRTAHAEALPQLAVLGIACGLLAGVVMMAFRMLIELGQAAILPPGPPENYAGLEPALRFALPVLGGLAIGLAFQALPPRMRHVGVVHVLERLAYHQGRLPIGNAVAQFLGAAGAIVAGLSLGREGPAIHLGAACASVAGQRLALPHNSIRVLVGCGVAGAIAASFNTPLAGVAFTMEVVLMEYSVVGFAPVILAAVSATAVTHLVYGDSPAFSVPPLTLASIAELPYVFAMGLAIGVLAASFIALAARTERLTSRWPVWVRGTAAGVLCGACAVPVPQIMGIGYDTVNNMLAGDVALGVMLAIVVLKLVATAGSVGLGLPGGLVGPVLVIGAAAGGVLGLVGIALAPTETSSHGFYALIGLGAMMGGTLHAPLAALTAMLELTGNPHIVWPGMLAVIAAFGVSRVVFRQRPVFVTLLSARGLDYHDDPVVQSLRRVGVGAAMNVSVVALPHRASPAGIRAALAGGPEWVLVLGADGPLTLIPAVDLARRTLDADGDGEIDLLDVPADRLDVAPVPLQATLQEALDALQARGADALYVVRSAAAGAYGILTPDDIARNYRYAIRPVRAAAPSEG